MLEVEGMGVELMWRRKEKERRLKEVWEARSS